MSNQNAILATFPVFLEIKKIQTSFKPGHSFLYHLVEHILRHPTEENAQYRKRWTKWKSYGLKPNQPLTRVQRFMNLQKLNSLGAYMDNILLCPNIENLIDISFQNLPYPAILVYKKTQVPTPIIPSISVPEHGTIVDEVFATEDPLVVHILDTPPTESHVIEFFPHDLASGAFNIAAYCKQQLEHMESEFASRLMETRVSYERYMTTSIEQGKLHQTKDLASLRTVVKEVTASIDSKHQQCLASINDASDKNIEHIISTVEENLSEFSTSAEFYTSQISNVTNGGAPYEELLKTTTKAELSTIEAAQLHHDTQILLTDLKSLQEAVKRDTNAMTIMKFELTNDKGKLIKLKKDIDASITEWKLLDKNVLSGDNHNNSGEVTFGTTYIALNDTKLQSPYHHGSIWRKGFRNNMNQVPELIHSSSCSDSDTDSDENEE